MARKFVATWPKPNYFGHILIYVLHFDVGRIYSLLKHSILKPWFSHNVGFLTQTMVSM